jgi:sugar O-acyltransferase (sialic acid O-acetyltransferase NeuD family)
MENLPVIIFGANFLGRQAKEIFENNGHVVYCFLDDNRKLHDTIIDNVTVMGSTDDGGFLKLIGKKCEAFIAIDENKVRKSLVTMLQQSRNVQPMNGVAATALISGSAALGHGNFVGHRVIIGPGTTIGGHCIVHPGAVIGSEVTAGDFVQVGSGSVINAGATIGNEVFIGSGVTIVGSVTVGDGARIGAGSVVVGPVKEGETVFGNPATVVQTAQ